MSRMTEEFKELGELQYLLADWTRFRMENSNETEALNAYKRAVEAVKKEIENLKLMNKAVNENEPDEYAEIQKLCEGNVDGKEIPKDFKERLEGAFIGRVCGCILGVPVEGWGIDGMAQLAKDTGTPFPPTEYWHDVANKYGVQYDESPRYAFIKDSITYAPSDDDIMFPLCNLLVMERYGKNFTTEQLAEVWKEQMTVVCTAEKEALENLKAGVSAEKAAENNPYTEWIGAAIRADAFGYVCPGKPHEAAQLAYKDAYLTHRGNGIYGEMFFAALIAAAFTCNGASEAINVALKEIPENCALAKDIRWAIESSKDVKNYLQARKAMEERFGTMSWVHVRNNAVLVIFALLLAENDYTKAISECVAMGMDNDCTAATVGSIMGALYGIKAIPEYWYKCFNDRIRTFMKDYKDFLISDVIERFYAIAVK